MNGAPGWRRTNDSVNGEWKIQLLRWLGETCGLRTLIETGTCEGSTPAALHKNFDKIYTIELHDGLYEVSRKRLQDLDNVFVYHGSSPEILTKLLPTLPPGPLLFWLDAHTSGPHTACEGDVLHEEIMVITKLRPESLVVIDDMPSAELLQIVARGVSLEGWIREYRTGEVIMHRGGFTIPPFESTDV